MVTGEINPKFVFVTKYVLTSIRNNVSKLNFSKQNYKIKSINGRIQIIYISKLDIIWVSCIQIIIILLHEHRYIT